MTQTKIWTVSWVMHDPVEGYYVWTHDIAFTDKEKALKFAEDQICHYTGVTVTGSKIDE